MEFLKPYLFAKSQKREFYLIGNHPDFGKFFIILFFLKIKKIYF